MIFIDSNVPMYLVGADHPHRRATVAILERLANEKRKLVTSVEVLQEILHRYHALRADEFIQQAFDTTYDIVDSFFPVEEPDALAAKGLLLSYKNLSARDALHAAQMKRFKIETIFSFDAGFDILPWIKRIPT